MYEIFKSFLNEKKGETRIVSSKLPENCTASRYRECITAVLADRGIKGARMPDDACTRGHASPRERACTRRGHPANSLVQACPIIGVGIRVSVHTYLPRLSVRPRPRPPPPPPALGSAN